MFAAVLLASCAWGAGDHHSTAPHGNHGTAALPLLGKCCEPAANLTMLGAGGLPRPRAAWIKANCTCVGSNSVIERAVTVPSGGKHLHFHWAMTNMTALGKLLTLRLVPCSGKPILLVKPAILKDGQYMQQLFETVARGPDSGYHTHTWPFPDVNHTAVLAQPLDADLAKRNVTFGQPPSSGRSSWMARTTPWGDRTDSEGVETTLTIVVRHPGYFVSVYSEMDTQFTLLTHLHPDAASNPVTMRGSSSDKARRASLSARWDDAGTVKVAWSGDGGGRMDQYQIYILKQPDEGLATSRGQGVCGLVGADLENGRDSRCNSWTPCGLRKNMIPVGGVFFGYNAGPGNVFEVDFAQIGLLLYRDNRYLVNVMRTPEDVSSGDEVYVGVTMHRNSPQADEDVSFAQPDSQRACRAPQN